MKIKQLIEYLQNFDSEDRICIKAWIKNKEGQSEKHFLRITGIDDDCNVGLWDLIADEFQENETAWEPVIDWDKVIANEQQHK
jgi:hypothetical protein